MPLHHQTQPALELEFYIPAAVWDHPATAAFLQEAYALVEGITILRGAKGVWQGQTETTNLVKVLIREDKTPCFNTLLPTIRAAIDRAVTAWAESGGDTKQEAFMFTVRQLTVHDTRSTSR